MNNIKVGRSCGVLFGSNANNGVNAGLTYVNSNNTPSNSNTNIGSHLCLKKLKGATTVPLGKRFKVN